MIRSMLKSWALLWLMILIPAATVLAFHPSVLTPRVPENQLEKYQDMDNPYLPTQERIEAGKKIYFGKGLCVTCHGNNGKGVEMPGHAPRDFTNRRWQEARTDGELMWVLRNGSPGTGMPIRVGKEINEEEGWNVILFIRTFAGK